MAQGKKVPPSSTFYMFDAFLNKLTLCSTALSEMIQLSYKCLMKADKHSLSAFSGASGKTNVLHSRVHTLAIGLFSERKKKRKKKMKVQSRKLQLEHKAALPFMFQLVSFSLCCHLITGTISACCHHFLRHFAVPLHLTFHCVTTKSILLAMFTLLYTLLCMWNIK